MSNTRHVELAIPDDVLEQLAARVADALRVTKAPNPSDDTAAELSPWLTVKDAAAYLSLIHI